MLGRLPGTPFLRQAEISRATVPNFEGDEPAGVVKAVQDGSSRISNLEQGSYTRFSIALNSLSPFRDPILDGLPVICQECLAIFELKAVHG